MAEEVGNNSLLLKNDTPKWQPSKTRYLDTFFTEHMDFIRAIGGPQGAGGNLIEKYVRGIGSLIPKKHREKIFAGYMDDFKTYVTEHEKLKGDTLNDLEKDHCYGLAWLDRLGSICDYQSRTYRVEGNEQAIGIFGMFGENPNGDEVMAMSEEALLALVGKKPKVVKVESGVSDDEEGGEPSGESS
jgi:hypothetical protein